MCQCSEWTFRTRTRLWFIGCLFSSIVSIIIGLCGLTYFTVLNQAIFLHSDFKHSQLHSLPSFHRVHFHTCGSLFLNSFHTDDNNHLVFHVQCPTDLDRFASVWNETILFEAPEDLTYKSLRMNSTLFAVLPSGLKQPWTWTHQVEVYHHVYDVFALPCICILFGGVWLFVLFLVPRYCYKKMRVVQCERNTLLQKHVSVTSSSSYQQQQQQQPMRAFNVLSSSSSVDPFEPVLIENNNHKEEEESKKFV